MKLNEKDLKRLILMTLNEVAGESEKQEAINFLNDAFRILASRYKMPDKEIRTLLDGYRRMIEKYDLKTVKDLYFNKYGSNKNDFNHEDVKNLIGKNKLNINPDFFPGKDAGWLKRTQDAFDAEIERRRKQKTVLDDPIMREGVDNKNKMFLLNADFMLAEYFKTKKSLL